MGTSTRKACRKPPAQALESWVTCMKNSLVGGAGQDGTVHEHT